MSFRLKAATIAAFTLSAVAAVTASDASQASGAVASNDISPVTIQMPADTQRGSSVDQKPVIFAAPREVIQPLATDKTPQSEKVSKTPISASSLAALVESHGVPEAIDEEMRCLAGAVYFESKGESLNGQLAVARVIINRAQSGRFASSLCGVVFQPGQFSFVRARSIPTVPSASRDWREAVAIARIAMDDSWHNPAEGALFFHARRVSPNWGKTRMAAIDNHVFYR